MKHRKILAFMLALVMVLSMVSGCSTQSGNNSSESKGTNFDVVVVGGGAAGLSAAIEAAKAGAKVVVIEKMSVVGGNTLFSEGIVYATGSKEQIKYQINDSAEALVNFWIDKAQGKNDVPTLQLIADRSGATVDWLVELGVAFNAPIATGNSPVLRAHMATDKGVGIIKALEKSANAYKVTFIFDTTVTELLMNENNIISGVKAIDKDQNESVYTANAVVLATGGFDKNAELVSKFAPIAQNQVSFSGEGNTGEGLSMAIDIGADVVSKGGVFGTLSVDNETKYDSEFNKLLKLTNISVNKRGERFVDESSSFPFYYEALVTQEDSVAFMIFDQASYDPILDVAVENGSAFVADSIFDLANLAGINPVGLTATVNTYNEMLDSGRDKQFGKNILISMPIKTGKYYAVKVVPAILGTMTGLKTNLDAQVLSGDGIAISGLYAAGEIALGDFYNTMDPAMGTSLQVGITFGRIAGANAANAAKVVK